jgi:predicted Zn-dependent protease with MMP-like domain
MDNDEQLQSANQRFQEEVDLASPVQEASENEEYDYNREPPLDHATASANRRRSKYVFMTLCFLLALILFYTYITGTYPSDSVSWFPLVGSIALAVLGIVFLRSSDSPPGSQEQPMPGVTSTKEEANEPEEALSPFEELVKEALSTIPNEFSKQMENVAVRVAYEPDEETLTRVGVREGHILLGLYEGVPLTTYGRANAAYPEVIIIYQRTIEEYCRHDPARIREQVRKTVLHEVAHHFGMGHEEMPIWIK